MGAQASLLIYDGKATPALHTFTVRGVRQDPKTGEDVAKYVNTAASVLSSGLETITFWIKESADKTMRYRSSLVMPITEVINSISVVTRVHSAGLTYRVAPNATLAEKTDLVKMNYNLASPGFQLGTAVTGSESIW